MKSRRHRVDPLGQRLPIKLDTTTNGEFAPIPLSRANRHARPAGARRRRTTTRSASASAGATSSSRPAAPRARCSRSTPPMRRPARRRLLRPAAPKPRSTRSSPRRALDGGEFIFDVQGHFVNRPARGSRPRRAARSAGRREGGTARRRGKPARAPSRLPRPRRVREGRLPRLRHRHDGAVVRAVDARGRAADDRGSGRDRARSSSAWRARTGCCCTGASTRTSRATSRTMDALARAVRSVARGRPTRSGGRTATGFFLDDDAGLALHREGAQARRQEHLRPQGPAVRPAVATSTPPAATSAASRSASPT